MHVDAKHRSFKTVSSIQIYSNIYTKFHILFFPFQNIRYFSIANFTTDDQNYIFNSPLWNILNSYWLITFNTFKPHNIVLQQMIYTCNVIVMDKNDKGLSSLVSCNNVCNNAFRNLTIWITKVSINCLTYKSFCS